MDEWYVIDDQGNPHKADDCTIVKLAEAEVEEIQMNSYLEDMEFKDRYNAAKLVEAAMYVHEKARDL